MAVAPAVPPQGGVAPQNAQQDQLAASWTDFFRRPETIAGLLQFGSSMLTPGSNIGTSLAEAAGAAGRVGQIQQQQTAEQQRQGLAEREQQARERQVAASERSAATQESQEKRQASEFATQQQLEHDRLENALKVARIYAGARGGGAGVPGLDFGDFYMSEAKNEMAAAELEGREPDMGKAAQNAVKAYTAAVAALKGQIPQAGQQTANPEFEAFLNVLTSGDATKKAAILADPQATSEAQARFAEQQAASGKGPELVAPSQASRPAPQRTPDAQRLEEIKAEIRRELGIAGKGSAMAEKQIEAQAKQRLQQEKR